MSEVTGRLESIFTVLMPKESAPARGRTKVNCASWDSLVQIQLVSTMEQEFGIRLSEEDAAGLNSFESAAQIVREKLKGGS